VPSAVATSKLTPSSPAGDERLTVKSNAVVPEFPSWSETSSIESVVPPWQTFRGEAVFRGAGVPAAKSFALSSVSSQPAPSRNAAVLLLRIGAAAAPSKKFAPP
jgi:hypothetical protein